MNYRCSSSLYNNFQHDFNIKFSKITFTPNNNIYNVGLSDANLTKLELCEKIKNFLNFNIILNEVQKDPDQRNYIVSNDKVENQGFKPKHSIEDGIQELIKGFAGYKFRNFSNV